MSNKTMERVKKVSAMAMLAALAIVADIFLRIPNIGGFLTYEPKDVILTIGAFIFGPVAGLLTSLVVCTVEMMTISSTGLIGLLMNFLSSAAFVGVASVIYHRKKTMARAIVGLMAACAVMMAVMLLWNYIVTPIYMEIPREAVLKLFLPLLIPFNALKASLNTAIILLLYKSVVTALRKSRFIPQRESHDGKNKKANTVILLIFSALAVATLLLVLLIFAGVF